jgi:hypothetical protein
LHSVELRTTHHQIVFERSNGGWVGSVEEIAYYSECLKGTRHGRPGSRYDDNIKVDVKGIGCKSMHWIYLAQDKLGELLLSALQ